ncbi:uncharacterized protein LOC119091485 [Pollicipes pollicipes]|uniref:uncharacterized protein LOC119091485 n=1 Tax=Pollicipes pollicipes TaxID=41117 RepID=UPI001884C4E9|nr:uncharacterized protein LOC119091485 [Pollicipes pollicipes]
MAVEDAEERRSPSPGGHSEGAGSARDKYRPRSRHSFSRSHSVTTYVFDEDEYTKIQTPRQDMIFKKSAFTRRRPPAEGSLSEETETQSTATPELSEASSDGKPNSVRLIGNALEGGEAQEESSEVQEFGEEKEEFGHAQEESDNEKDQSGEEEGESECGEAPETRDPLAALASQIQYAFIDPQGNVFFNVMDESGIIHLPPVAGYYMAESYPGGPMIATPVPWQAVPIAPLNSPEYQALMQELADGEGSSPSGSRPRSAMSDANSAPATSGAGSRPHTPTPPGRHSSSGHEHADAEPENQDTAAEEGKTRRVKKKKKKQKKKTNSVDSGVTDEGSDGCRDVPPTPDCAVICLSDSSASGGRVRPEPKSERSPSEQTSGVQSDVSLPDSPQRRPSGDCVHVTSVAPPRDSKLLHSAARVLGHVTDAVASRDSRPQDGAVSVLCCERDSQPAMQSAPPSSGDSAALPRPGSQPKNDRAAASASEAAILSPVQPAAESGASDARVGSSVAHEANAIVLDERDAAGADASDDNDEGDVDSESPERVDGDDGVEGGDGDDGVEGGDGDGDAESCDSFVYEDKSAADLAASPPPTDDAFLGLPNDHPPPQCEPDPCGEDASSSASREGSCTSQGSEVVPEFEDEAQAPPSFTDLSVPVDLRRTVILEETESERDRESSPGSATSEESAGPPDRAASVGASRQSSAPPQRVTEGAT